MLPFCSEPIRPDAGFDAREAWRRARVSAGETWSNVPGENPFDLTLEDNRIRDEYGRTSFGQTCLLARRLVEGGVHVVTVNMFETVFNRITWDCHGRAPFSTLDDYARVLLPEFDRAFSALIDDLERRGRLDSTLVIAAGEFGRTPRINSAGGRDHWPGVWSIALAGGGVRGGQVLAQATRTRLIPPTGLSRLGMCWRPFITAWASMPASISSGVTASPLRSQTAASRSGSCSAEERRRSRSPANGVTWLYLFSAPKGQGKIARGFQPLGPECEHEPGAGSPWLLTIAPVGARKPRNIKTGALG